MKQIFRLSNALVVALGACIGVSSGAALAQTPAKKPNILFIMADDIGWLQVGAYQGGLGYTTGEFGKNHLGDHTDALPTAHGFQEFWGYLYHLDAMQQVSFPDINKT